ncbi:class I tRNA ligase family protein [Candidatus Uhrbacteria bacterium]|nr:class I tRNA ligase family protein [Candidatus Uhrbacteria bacterium]
MAKFHLPTLEEEQLAAWDEKKIFEKLMARKDNPRGKFVFFEGPPTANNKPGIHHQLTRAYKDVILRYRSMRGHFIERKAGWDTHGLPVELEVEKKLGFTKKQDIEAYGIAAFNEKCRENVWTYLDLWEKSTKRIGFWVDLKNAYITYKNDYVESLWWVLKQIDKSGLLYEGYRVTPHCPRCVTSLSSHELAQGYKDAEDPSVYVKFAFDASRKEYFLVWTTTPWTLPANVALAVGADVAYVKAKMKATGETLILAKDRLSVLDGEYEIVEETNGADLVHSSYAPLYKTLAAASAEELKNNYKVYAADFVSTADGTGIVHIAPAFGEDDSRLGQREKLATLVTVDPAGMVTAEVPGKGKFFKKADAVIEADLTERGLMYKSGTYTHSYPFCWRCSTPILYYAKSSWYIRMSELRERLMRNNAQINWLPAHIRDGRFGEWLREVKDWALSRERYWGTPLPVWRCASCAEKTVIGSFEELDWNARPKNRYFLQRHGEAETNVSDTVSSWPEKKEHRLTAKGRDQVAAAAKELKGKGIEMIFSSDVLRTKETAEIISKELGLEVVFDARLRETDFGVKNGAAIAEYHAGFKDHLEQFAKAVEGGESFYDVRRRMIGFVKELERQHRGKKILIVSHGDPLWLLETGFSGATDEEALKASYNNVGEFHELELKNLPYDEMGHVDPHRPYIDEVVLACRACGGEMRRSADVVDVWFDSGAMPYAQWHYPFENADRIDKGESFPADFITEAIDQTRGWFYTLLAVSTLLGKDVPPYKNVICLGHVLDAKGQKMSKSKGNAVDVWEMIGKYGADSVRLYFYSVSAPGDPKRFDEKGLDEIVKKVFLILWNVLTFWKPFAAEAGDEPSTAHPLDRWIAAKTRLMAAAATAHLEAYRVTEASRLVMEHVNDISTWYLRRSRDRFKSVDAADRRAAASTLRWTLMTLAKLMAPMTPFLADALYRELGGKLESVHLDAWPDLIVEAGDEAAVADMDSVRTLASLALEKRAAAGIPVRQVLAALTVRGRALDAELQAVLAEEVNVKKVVVEERRGNAEVELDTVITPELRQEGALRELVRHVNALRKDAGLARADRVVIRYEGKSALFDGVVAGYKPDLMAATVADDVKAGRGDVQGTDLAFEDGAVWVGVEKV